MAVKADIRASRRSDLERENVKLVVLEQSKHIEMIVFAIC